MSSAAAAAPRKLRLLCIHGFFQSAVLFRLKTAAMRKALKGVAELEYVQGPHMLGQADHFKHKPLPDAVPEDTYFAWWRMNAASAAAIGAKSVGSSAAPASASAAVSLDPASMRYNGWVESLAALKGFVEAQGPFDGYIGFSQGAAFLALVAALANLQTHMPNKIAGVNASDREAAPTDYSWFTNSNHAAASAATTSSYEAAASSPSSPAAPLSPPLLIFVSGFIPRVSHLKQFFPRPLAAAAGSTYADPAHALAPFAFDQDIPLIDFPSLHILGTGDVDVAPAESDALRRAFLNSQLETHDGGHLVPNNAEFVRKYKKFLQERGQR